MYELKCPSFVDHRGSFLNIFREQEYAFQRLGSIEILHKSI